MFLFSFIAMFPPPSVGSYGSRLKSYMAPHNTNRDTLFLLQVRALPTQRAWPGLWGHNASPSFCS